MLKHPEDFGFFNQWMATQRVGMPTWLDVYPVAKETKDWDPERPLFVDVGGGVGHQCVALKKKFPETKGRVVLQDIPNVLEQAMKYPGVESMVHDIFTPQPIKGMLTHFLYDLNYKKYTNFDIGAKYYYMRNSRSKFITIGFLFEPFMNISCLNWMCKYLYIELLDLETTTKPNFELSLPHPSTTKKTLTSIQSSTTTLTLSA